MSVTASFGIVILAAGKGTRLGCTDIPKVMLELSGKPMVAYTVETFEQLGFPPEQIVLVVGFQKEKVMEYFGNRVTYAIQSEQKGTAHAAYVGMQALPQTCSQVLVLGGDDSAFYTAASLDMFMARHLEERMMVSLLTAVLDDPDQLGRVVRHPNGDIEVIEKEYLTPEQREIHEISTGTFCFDRDWFLAMYPSMPPLRKLGEYGLPTALAVARAQHDPYHVVTLERATEWFGVNTPDQYKEAQQRKKDNSI